jgi:hypothetical protein
MPIDTALDPAASTSAVARGIALGLGWSPDLDEAFDAAKEAAMDRFGAESPVPSLAAFDAGTATPLSGEARPLHAALAAAFAAPTEPGELRALPLAAAKRWSRRRLRLRSVELTPALPDDPAWLWDRTGELDRHLDGLLSAMGTPRAPTEVYDEVELVRVNARYKAVATRHQGRTVRMFALVSGGEILGVESSSAAARRRAIELVKAGRGLVEVVSCGLRGGDDGHVTPTLTVERTLVRRTATIRVVLASPKAEAVPVDGWLFVGAPLCA